MKNDVNKVISIFSEIGVPKEKVNAITNELMDNSRVYVNNAEAIDVMLQERLGIDLYISLKQYKPLY